MSEINKYELTDEMMHKAQDLIDKNTKRCPNCKSINVMALVPCVQEMMWYDLIGRSWECDEEKSIDCCYHSWKDAEYHCKDCGRKYKVREKNN